MADRNLWSSILSEHIGFSIWTMWSVLVLFMGPEYGIDAAGKFFLVAVGPGRGILLGVYIPLIVLAAFTMDNLSSVRNDTGAFTESWCRVRDRDLAE